MCRAWSYKIKQKIAIIGNGGHASACASLATELGFSICSKLVEVEFVDHGQPLVGSLAWLVPAVNQRHECESFEDHNWIIGIGSGAARERIAQRLGGSLHKPQFPSLVSHHANVPHGVNLGEGTLILPGAVVSRDSTVGRFSIINSGAILEHQSQIGDFSHLAPGSAVLGGASVGSNCLVGANSVIGQKVTLPDQSTLGALSFLSKSPVVTGGTHVGSPAKQVN